MADMVEFASNGNDARGYLVLPEGGTGPGVIVIQEWWGLDSGTKEMADRLGAAGFVALAPDLYHGELAAHDEMDKAGELMNSLPPDRAARDMAGAIDFLLAHDSTTGDKVGVIGFCMGGLLTLMISALQGDRVGAATPFYGAPLGENEPDWSGLTAPVQGHFAGRDDFFPAEAVKALEDKLVGMGKDVTFIVHEGVGHAFANEENALGTHDETRAAEAMSSAVAFLKSKLS